MNILNDVSLTRLITPELRTFADEVITAVAELGVKESFIRRSIDAMNHSQIAITTIHNIPRGSDYAADIKNTDSDMDDALRLSRRILDTAIEAAKYEPQKAEAAAKLLPIYAKRSTALYDGGFKEQNSEVTDFLADIMTPALAETRKVAGVAAVLDTVVAKFKHLKELFAARGSEESAPSTVNEQKAVLRFRLDSLLNFVNTNCVDNVEGYAAVVAPINAAIASVMTTYRARNTRKENEEEAKAIPAS